MNVLESFRLDGRRALITGSTQGIGLALAQSFASAGATHLYLNSEAQNAHAEQAVESVQAIRPEAEVQHLTQDLALPRAGADLAARTLELSAGYGVDILVLCAGIQIEEPWREVTAEHFEKQIRVNHQASLELIQGLTPAMEARGWGRVLIISSIQARVGSAKMLVYSNTKAALNSMARILARSLGPSGITINTLSPGFIDTPRNANVFREEADKIEKWMRHIPLRRPGQPEDCVGPALMLCSNAGSYITGADIQVDGGM